MKEKPKLRQTAEAWQLTVDPELAALCRPLTDEERSLLEADIQERGCLDDVIVWPCDGKRIIVDGHHRHEICRSLSIEFGVSELAFEDCNQVLAWIAEHQRARRNLTPEELSYLRGKRYEATKSQHGGDRKGDGSSAQSAHLIDRGRAADRLAAESNVNQATIRRDAEFARAVDTIGHKAGRTARERVLAGDALASKGDIVKLSELTPAKIQKALIGEAGAIKRAVTKAELAKLERDPFRRRGRKPAPARIPDSQVDALLHDLRHQQRNLIAHFPAAYRVEAIAEARVVLDEEQRRIESPAPAQKQVANGRASHSPARRKMGRMPRVTRR